MSVMSYLNTMEYAPNFEDATVAQKWLRNHAEGFGHFINGAFTPHTPNKAFTTVCPADKTVLATLSQGTPEDVDMAVQSARNAHKIWSKMSPHQRAVKLYALARIIQRNARLLAVVESLDNGKSIRESRDIDVPLSARHFYHHAGWAQVVDTHFAEYESMGVIGQIIPWNFPLLMLAWKIAPALAMGNTVVLKPADLTPLSALLFAQFVQSVGIPDGVINIVTGDGKTGEAIATHPDVDKIAFTGSTAVGKHLRQITAGTGKKLTLELGGKSPFIVFEDGDIDAAVEGVVNSIWFNQGQVCCAGSRLIVQASIADIFHQKLHQRMQNIRLGHALDKTIDMGAIISKTQLHRITHMVAAGVKDGGILIQPDFSVPDTGFYYPPTILRDVPVTSAAAMEEIFGPVAVSTTFRTVDEAITLANHSKYGLSASIWSESINLTLEVASALHTGVVWVNGANMLDAGVGFGGRKQSGYGREGGIEGCYAYLQHKTLYRGKTRPAPPIHTPNMAVIQTDIDRTLKLFIGGKQTRPDGQYALPVVAHDGKVLAQIPVGNRKDIRNAVQSARSATAWANATAHNRTQILYYMGENLMGRKSEFVDRIRAMTGANDTHATAEVDLSIARLFAYGAYADTYEGTVHNPPMRGLALAIPEAIGVTGVICPPECPLLGFVSTIAPLISMGNTVVAVPSVPYPLSALDFYSILETSDVPGGVVNIVSGDPHTLVQTMAQHHDMDALWVFGDADICTTAERLSANSLKRTFVDHGTQFDWFHTACQGAYFLRHSTEIKNIWVPYGE